MLFNSFGFLVFFPAVVLAYYLMPHRLRKFWLVLASYFFYSCFDVKYVFWLFFCTTVSWRFGFLLHRYRKKGIFWIGIILTLCPLVTFKYGLILPIGISFYTLQAVSYLADVFREDIEPEKNFIKYMLYMAFFPTIMSGPIKRAGDFIGQIDIKKNFDYEAVRSGLYLMVWGYVQKILAADSVSGVVARIYDNPGSFSGIVIWITTILYGIQIYFDFAGYSCIAAGAARALGYQIDMNFLRPYMAVSIKDFWRRWHISLSSWLRDYIYIPLGGNRRSVFRKYVNLFFTFLVSGVWHGAGLTFLFWGALHGFYQIAGDVLMPVKRRIRNIFDPRGNSKAYRILQSIVAFLLVDFAWMFFRASGLKSALLMTGRIFFHFYSGQNLNQILNELNVGASQVLWWLAVILLLGAIDLCREKRIALRVYFEKQNAVLRWAVYLVIVMIFLFAAVTGTGIKAAGFIYNNF